jgi:hypothetical protein
MAARDAAREPGGVHSALHISRRALSRTSNLRLQALARPAIDKRPSVTEWIGRDLALIACGILEEMLDDRALQRSIADREIACILTRTRGVLRTREHAP